MTTATQDTNVIEQAGEQMLDAVEALFEEVVSERRDFTEAELAKLRQLGFDVTGYVGTERVLTRERRRVKEKLNRRGRAGTPQVRGRLRKKADEAREAAESRLPEIEQAIAELEREKQQLEKSRDESEKAAADAEQAVQALRDVRLLPRHLQKRAGEVRAEVKRRHEPVLRAARDAVAQAERCASLKPGEDWFRDGPASIRYCHEHLPSALTRHQRGNEVSYTIEPAKWDAHQQQQREALPRLREELAEAEQALEADLDEAMKPFFE